MVWPPVEVWGGGEPVVGVVVVVVGSGVCLPVVEVMVVMVVVGV